MDTDPKPAKASRKNITKESELKSPKGEFKTKKFGLKRRHSSITYVCRECGKRKKKHKRT